MQKYLFAFFSLFFPLLGNAAAGDQTWFFQSFTDVSYVITTDMNFNQGLTDLCWKKKYADLTNLEQPSYSTRDSAFGHKLGDFAAVSREDENFAVCAYTSGVENDDTIYFLYIYAETECDSGSKYDREQRKCVAKIECEAGQTVLLSGFSSTLVQTSPNTVYIADGSPASTCRKLDGASTACSFDKPAYSHSCYSDSPLSWDSSGNLVGSGTGHCNYQYVNSGSECTDTSGALGVAWGGYSLSAGSNDFTCADGITSAGCPGDSGDGGSGSDGSGTGTGGNGGSSGGSDSGSGGSGSGSDGSEEGNGSSGGGSSSNGSSASGTSCNANLSCSGDAVQCAILAQQKKSACSLADLTKTDDAAAQSLLSGEKFELSEKTVEVTSLFERARFLPDSCPADIPLNLSFGTFYFSFSLICEFSSALSALIVIAASIAGLMIVIKD